MNEKSEQIDSRLNILLDGDQPLSPRELDNHLMAVLNAQQEGSAHLSLVSIADKEARFVAYDVQGGSKHALLTSAVTFLGGNGNHPIFKKRIQLKSWYKPASAALKRAGYEVHFLGVYHYEDNLVFVDFGTETYLKRKMHNSSAFVYVNDLFRAMKDGVATRIDLHGNSITTIRRDKLAQYLNGITSASNTGDLIDVFATFNGYMPFKKWIKGQDAVRVMQENAWTKWRETEWPGWFLEFKFASFLTERSVRTVVYQGNASKKADALDFDLLFPVHKFYGDLKASDIDKKESPGNDLESLMEAIDRCDRFWYVIYEHETVKDKTCGNAMTKFRYDFLLAIDGSAKSPLSYAARMKNRVNFKKMMILELNRANCGELLSSFHQGHQPDGKKRAEKVLINKHNVENYQVFHYEA